MKLTKQRKQEIIKKFQKSCRSTSVSSGIMRSREVKVQRRETPDGSTKRTLTLRIQTDSESPIYKDWWGDSYVEKIGSNAYDETLNKTKSGEAIVYSFADHDMKMDSVLSSTNREGTKFYKDSNNNYVYEMELDPSIPRHSQIITMMENDELKANSFIFYPEEIEVEDAPDGADYDYIVIQKSGELLSIDPVMYAFYPQNDITMKGDFMNEAQRREAEAKAKEAEAKKLADEAKAAEEQRLADEAKKAEEDAKAAEEQRLADEAKKAEEDAKAAEEQRLADEAKKAEEDAKAAEEQRLADEAKEREAELDKSSKFKALSIAEQRSFLNGKLTAREVIAQIDKEAISKRQEIARKLQANKEAKMTEAEKAKLRKSQTSKWMLRGNAKASKLNNEELRAGLGERNEEVITQLEISDEELGVYGITRASGLTGATGATGAAIIAVKTDAKVVSEDEIVMVEALGATRIGITSLDEVKIGISAGSSSAAPIIAEGADSTEDDSTVYKLQFTPDRRSKILPYNPHLTNIGNTVKAKTTENKNSITLGLQTGFYNTLTAQAGSDYDAIAASYAGGVTGDNLIDGEETSAGVLERVDLDAMIDAHIAKFGTFVPKEFKFTMSPASWARVVKEARADGNGALIGVDKDLNTATYRDVPVIFSGLYKEGPAKVGAVMYRAANVVLFGGIFVQRDSIEAGFEAEMNKRQITNRGQLKLGDPMKSTYGIKFA